jgi:hypothetical protein
MPALYCGRRRGRQRSKRGVRHAGASVSRPQADQVVHGDDNGEHPPTRRIPPCPLLRIKPIVFNPAEDRFPRACGSAGSQRSRGARWCGDRSHSNALRSSERDGV